MISIGIAGKPNCGKSTFFKASTMANVEIADYPFTTIDANHGVAYVRTTCPCQSLRLKCQKCNDGIRYVPIGMIDVAGLVPDAHKGRGLGNQFLDHLREADAIIHIVDASGATDSEGNLVPIGSHNPEDDIQFLYKEMTMWFHGILEKHWPKLLRQAQTSGFSIEQAIADTLAGLGVKLDNVHIAEQELGINLHRATPADLILFCDRLLRMSKPILIVANKIDQTPADIVKKMANYNPIYASAAAELALRNAAATHLIRYFPGDSTFTIVKPEAMNNAQKAGLNKIERVMQEFGGTGVQQAINKVILEILNMIIVYPVEDEHKFSDKQGNILPDAFIMKRGSTPHDLAFKVHTDIGEGFLYAIDARTRMRIKESYNLKNGDIIKIVSTAK